MDGGTGPTTGPSRTIKWEDIEEATSHQLYLYVHFNFLNDFLQSLRDDLHIPPNRRDLKEDLHSNPEQLMINLILMSVQFLKSYDK